MTGEAGPLVLVVDDDPAILELIERTLTRRGFRVESLTSAFGVVNRLGGREGERPALLILDQMMPALSGTGLLALLAKHPEAREVPVILHTAADRASITGLDVHPRVRFQSKGSVRALAEVVVELLGRPDPA